jgi:hypothetical protein
VARTFSIGKTDQQITFEVLADKKFGDADFGLIAAASSNLAVSLAAAGNCTLNGSQVHLTGAGLCTITASQDGDANINAAVPVARSFAIGKADQQITFEALADRKFGNPDFTAGATSSTNLTVSLAATGNCTLAGSQVHLTGAGQCTITASQDGDEITLRSRWLGLSPSARRTSKLRSTFGEQNDRRCRLRCRRHGFINPRCQLWPPVTAHSTAIRFI